MKRVQITADARADLEEGFVFYEAQGVGLGEYFASCLRSDIDGLKVTGGIHRVVLGDIH